MRVMLTPRNSRGVLERRRPLLSLQRLLLLLLLLRLLLLLLQLLLLLRFLVLLADLRRREDPRDGPRRDVRLRNGRNPDRVGRGHGRRRGHAQRQTRKTPQKVTKIQI
jgi:hypothetical protein